MMRNPLPALHAVATVGVGYGIVAALVGCATPIAAAWLDSGLIDGGILAAGLLGITSLLVLPLHFGLRSYRKQRRKYRYDYGYTSSWGSR